MKQRLGLATAILTRPRYLILDEPINGLGRDPLVKRVSQRLRRNKEKQY